MHSLLDVDLGHFPFHINTQADYEAACARCEILVYVGDAAMRIAITAALDYDKKRGGSAGRAMTRGMAAAGLLKGDRLEPSGAIEDVSLFETTPAPFYATFWRPTRASIALHRNPLYDPYLGVTVSVMCIDSLHTLYLGVIMAFCRDLLWALIGADDWGTRAGTLAERVQLFAQIFCVGVLVLFSRRRASHHRPCCRRRALALAETTQGSALRWAGRLG